MLTVLNLSFLPAHVVKNYATLLNRNKLCLQVLKWERRECSKSFFLIKCLRVVLDVIFTLKSKNKVLKDLEH